MFTVTVTKPDGKRHSVVCLNPDDCLEVVLVEAATAKPWTLIHMTRGGREVATWGIGPHGKIARKPPRMRRPMR